MRMAARWISRGNRLRLMVSPAQGVEDAGGLIDGTVAGVFPEDGGGVAGFGGDVEVPAADAAACGYDVVETAGGFEAEGDVTGLRAVDEIFACDVVRGAGSFFIAGKVGDDVHVPELAGGLERLEGSDDDDVAAFHIIDALAGGGGVVQDGIGAGGHIGFEDGVEMADEEEMFPAFLSYVGGYEVSRFSAGVSWAWDRDWTAMMMEQQSRDNGPFIFSL